MPKYIEKCPQHTELDIYYGCSFNCLYCISNGREQNKEFVLDDELNKIAEDRAGIYPYYLSPWTDAYQHIEEQKQHTRKIIEQLSLKNLPFFVITKSLLIKRDLDFFRSRENSFIAVSLNTLNDLITSEFEPSAPSASDRKMLLEELVTDKSLKIVVKVDPIIPGVTDGNELLALLEWLSELKPFAVTAETLRLTTLIANKISSYVGKALADNILRHYPQLTLQPVHPEFGYRLKVLNLLAGKLKRAGVKTSFCWASLPYKITEFDCRGGYNYDY